MSEYVYILFDKPNGETSIGVTSNLLLFMYELKNKISSAVIKEKKNNKLAYYEKYGDLNAAIVRKTELEELSKEDLKKLIKEDNPNWQDLYSKIMEIWNDSAKLHEKNQINKRRNI